MVFLPERDIRPSTRVIFAAALLSSVASSSSFCRCAALRFFGFLFVVAEASRASVDARSKSRLVVTEPALSSSSNSERRGQKSSWYTTHERLCMHTCTHEEV